MEEVLKQIIVNLQHIGIGVILFLAAYGSNMGFSIYLNTKILGESFDKSRIINSLLKILSFCIGATLLCIAITGVPIFTNYVGLTIPKEYAEFFQNSVILIAFLTSTCQYVVESCGKLKQILSKKTIIEVKNTETESTEAKN